MPTYYARGVSVRLGAMPLAGTTTPNIVLKKGEVARRQCEDAEQKLRYSAPLHEERVNFPGDEAGFGLHWLGDAPFMQVQTGEILLGKEIDSNVLSTAMRVNSKHSRLNLATDGSYAPARQDNNDLLALTLHVQLSDNTFISGVNGLNKVHLKIDVFFNGQLSSCLFLPPHDIRSGSKSLHQVFAGCRTDFLSERPWVIVPPQKNVDGSPRKIESFISAEMRWKDICNALRREADERGMDQHGNIPPSAEFLTALTNMQMPDQAKNMQKHGSRTFGVMDVVITAGDGRKVTSGAGYLKAPQRLNDENFPIRVVPNDIEVQGDPWIRHNEAEGDDAQNFAQSTKGKIDMDLEDESGSAHESSPKRQALTPVLPTSKPVHPHLSRNQFTDTEIPSTPGTILDMPERSIDCAMLLSSNKSSLPKINECLKDTTSSSEYGQISQGYTDHTEHSTFGNASYGTPQSFYSFPSSSAGLTCTPQMRSSPYSFPSFDPVMGQKTHSDLLNLGPFDRAGGLSSPLQQTPRSMDRPPSRSLPFRHTHELEAIKDDRIHLPPPASIGWPESPRRSSMVTDSILPLMPVFPQLRPSDSDLLQSPGVSRSPGYIPNMLPMSTSFDNRSRSMLDDLSYHPSYDNQLTMSLPPTGLFSVPTKPLSNRYVSKEPRIFQLKKPPRSILVNQLIITGKNGAIVVNHQWSSAQHIGPLDGKKQGSVSKSQGVCGTFNTKSLGSPPSADGIFEPMRRVDGAVAQKMYPSLQNMKTNTRDTTTPPMPHCLTTSDTNSFGVQGPKATTFWLEDPEEILREAARLRRSRGLITRNKKSQATIKCCTSGRVATVQNTYAKVSSSPLSSAPTSPEPEGKLNISTDQARLTDRTTDLIAQIDGSPERKVATTSPLKCTTSPKKLASTSIPRLPPNATSKPQVSLSPNTKKRKAQGRSLPKQPRSPDRLKTVSNPPLNRDCVIAFAESEDKDSERGVLRQVRGERQGVFAEEYVVFATRFFVAGN
jgi:hypothetical protein